MLQKLPCVACHTQGKEVHSELLYRSFENSYTRPPSPKYVAMQDLGRVWRCLQGVCLVRVWLHGVRVCQWPFMLLAAS